MPKVKTVPEDMVDGFLQDVSPGPATFTCSLCGATTEDEEEYTYVEVGVIFGKWSRLHKDTYLPPVERLLCFKCIDKPIWLLLYTLKTHFETQVAGWKEGS